MEEAVETRDAEEVEAAAQLALVGVDPLQFLRLTDPLEVRAMQAVAHRALELRRQEAALEREHLAVLIRNEIAEMLG